MVVVVGGGTWVRARGAGEGKGTRKAEGGGLKASRAAGRVSVGCSFTSRTVVGSGAALDLWTWGRRRPVLRNLGVGDRAPR